MRDTLATDLRSWGRKALLVGALIAAPALAPAPADAAPVHGLRAEAPRADVQTVQYGGYYGRPHYRHWHRPPPPYYRHYYGRPAWYRGYPPPRPYYRPYYRPYGYYR
ncbi:hypothetical protein [Muricoccus radiodurans]|uniref:hypothetical protein n=1 Tax=Muricoccus radiodurans TaxID=2231721 RepID=UPI003CEDFDB0